MKFIDWGNHEDAYNEIKKWQIENSNFILKIIFFKFYF